MLTIFGHRQRLCDGVSRRSFLKIGSLGLAGLSLPDYLRARASQPASQRRHQAVILYWMAGGPSHIDTYDMKPEAPKPVRGPFRPLATRVPGMQFCELLPRQARIADKISLVRSLTHTNYHALGIDSAAMVNDRQIRPIRLASDGQPIHELF